MTVTMSSRAFNQNVSQARKAAKDGPVIITDRGKPSHVLMTIEEYRRLAGRPMSLAEALAHPESADIEFNPPRLEGKLFRPADFD